jgi:hypothetical protein
MWLSGGCSTVSFVVQLRPTEEQVALAGDVLGL